MAAVQNVEHIHTVIRVGNNFQGNSEILPTMYYLISKPD